MDCLFVWRFGGDGIGLDWINRLDLLGSCMKGGGGETKGKRKMEEIPLLDFGIVGLVPKMGLDCV